MKRTVRLGLVLPLTLLAAVVTGCSGGGSGSSGGGGDSGAGTTQQPAGSTAEPTVRSTSFGTVVGAEDSATGTYSWLGIPYAAPPVDDLRWQAPTDPAAWSTALEATSFGAACTQAAGGSEDCLTLNIWRPASTATDLPVLVFIHGGSNVAGSSAVVDYRGANFAADQNVVVVSVHYRLGVLGWLTHSALDTGNAVHDSGNYGTLDLVKALEFVQDNIEAFGGDPDNVTISGQSAGAKNVWSLIMSPQADGLFQKAVSLSGGFRCATPADGRIAAETLLEDLLIADGSAVDRPTAQALLLGWTDPQRHDYLYGKSAADLVAVQGGVTSVFCDGTVLPTSMADGFLAGSANLVPVMAGVTAEEGKYFACRYGACTAQVSTHKALFQPNDPTAHPVDIADLVQPGYLPGGDPTAVGGYNDYTADFGGGPALLSTEWFWNWDTATLNQYQAQQPQVYAYSFAWNQQPAPWNVFTGAAHVADVAFWLGNFSSEGIFGYTYSDQNAPGREALSAIMRDALGAFVRNGDPNNASLTTTWQPWSTGVGPKRLVLDGSDAAATVTMTNSNTPAP